MTLTLGDLRSKLPSDLSRSRSMSRSALTRKRRWWCNRVLSFSFGSALCEVVDDRPFPLSETVYNTFVFGGRSVVSEHIGYYTDRKGNDIVLENNWCWVNWEYDWTSCSWTGTLLPILWFYLVTHSFAHSLDSSPLLSFYHSYRKYKVQGRTPLVSSHFYCTIQRM